MNDLENRLRTTLDELAGTLPPSQHARADFERRLARRRGRGLVLAVAAAAAVVAGVVLVPTLLTQDGGAGGQAAAPPLSTTSAPPPTYTAGPFVLSEYTKDGQQWTTALTVSPDPRGGGQMWCVEEFPEGDVESRFSACTAVPTWPEKSHGGTPEGALGMVGSIHEASPLQPNLVMFTTAPEVATLEVRRGDGSLVEVKRVTEIPGANFYLADFDGSSAGFGYTAKDAAGNVLESAIT